MADRGFVVDELDVFLNEASRANQFMEGALSCTSASDHALSGRVLFHQSPNSVTTVGDVGSVHADFPETRKQGCSSTGRFLLIM